MKDKQYYYSQAEWDRLGCGPLPPERSISNLQRQEEIVYYVYPEHQGEEDRPLNPYSTV